MLIHMDYISSAIGYTCHLCDRKIWDISISVPKYYVPRQLPHKTDESLALNVETMSLETQLLRHACLRSLVATSGCNRKAMSCFKLNVKTPSNIQTRINIELYPCSIFDNG